MPVGDERLVRAPHLALEWDSNVLVVTTAHDGSRFSISPEIVSVLDVADVPFTRAELARRTKVNVQFIEHLANNGLLVAVDDASLADLPWSTFELAVQRKSGTGGSREEIYGDVPPNHQVAQGRCIMLPKSAALPNMDLSTTLQNRRSSREFATGKLDFEVLGTLLHYSARVQWGQEGNGYSFRPYPSGGGRHPLEIYVLAMNVCGLSRSAYRYDPFAHCLYTVREGGDRMEEIVEELDAYTGGLKSYPSVTLLITAVFARTMAKYEDLGLTLIYKDVGGLLQTLYLVSTALGLSSVAVGGGPEARNARWLSLDPMEESQVGCFVVGNPPGG